MSAEKVTLSGKDPEDMPEGSGAPAPINPMTGQHKDHWILPEEERAKGFIRPVRRTYKHVACGAMTSMPESIAETYARDPKFYGSTFCCNCKRYMNVDGFVWEDGSVVGS